MSAAEWSRSDPALWRRAASDWRALWAMEQAPRRGRQELAAELGYAGPSKIDTFLAEGKALRAAAAAGDVEALARVDRAERLGALIYGPVRS
jgi:hypothetical protein